MKKAATRILTILLILIIIVAAGAGYYFKVELPANVAQESFPQTAGEIDLEGLNAPVEIYRDAMGIPHIYATTAHDLFFAQGYIHAQDRFWQMDFWRHTGSGTLSEMFGSGQVETDTFLRTLGWRRTAEAEYEGLDPDARAILQSYAEGVNAYLDNHQDTALSLEYAVLGLLSPDYELKEWTPVNTLTWGKAMAWELRGNLTDELQRAVALKTLTPEQVQILYPEYPEDHPVIVNKIGDGQAANNSTEQALEVFDYSQLSLDQVAENASLLDNILGKWSREIGSNSWAISGELTNTGKPYLVNDPHLGIQMPSIWYQVGLHCVEISDDCPFSVAGFSFAGVPGVVIGHNENIAWGLTNLGPDVMDLYIEKINPDNPNQYEINGEWVDFEIIEETVGVVGKDSIPITIRVSRHGPIISEAYNPVRDTDNPKDKEFQPFKERAGIDLPETYAVALSWTALSPSTPFEAIWKFDRASNWDEFREAARDFHVPAQNLLYADIEGNIGYQTPGDIPIRAKGDGTVPVPGWTDEYEWTGLIPFEELPYTFNPPEGYIVAANNQAHPRDYPYLLTKDWNYGYRAQRIVDMIENGPEKLDIAYLQSMQGDSYDLGAEAIIPIWNEINFNGETKNETKALEMIKNWDYQSTADSVPAAVYQRFWWHLDQNTFNDDLIKRYWVAGGDREYEAMRYLITAPNDFFWDDKTTEDVTETRDDIYIASLTEAVKELEKEYGKDPAQWPTWGEIHTASFHNATLGKSGIFLIEDLFNRGPFSTSGGQNIVNATGWDVGVSYEVDWLPSMRMIVDFSNLDNSLTVHTTGQSGHAYHEHYIDMAPLWANVEYYPMWWDKTSIENDSDEYLKLIPK